MLDSAGCSAPASAPRVSRSSQVGCDLVRTSIFSMAQGSAGAAARAPPPPAALGRPAPLGLWGRGDTALEGLGTHASGAQEAGHAACPASPTHRLLARFLRSRMLPWSLQRHKRWGRCRAAPRGEAWWEPAPGEGRSPGLHPRPWQPTPVSKTQSPQLPAVSSNTSHLTKEINENKTEACEIRQDSQSDRALVLGLGPRQCPPAPWSSQAFVEPALYRSSTGGPGEGSPLRRPPELKVEAVPPRGVASLPYASRSCDRGTPPPPHLNSSPLSVS